MSSKALTCESCGGPLTFGATFCAYCRVPLTWGRHLSIERGEPFFLHDFTRENLPNATKNVQRRSDGALVTIEKEDWERWGSFDPKMRDACVAIRGVTLDASGDFGVYARLHSEGSARAGYQVKVFPAYRSWRLRRETWWSTHTQSEDIVAWEFSQAIGGVGSVNDVELRFSDSVFQVVLNGQRVATVVDACFGFGGLAWVVGSHPTPSQVVLQAAAAWRAR